MGAVSLVIQQYRINSVVFYTYSSLQNYIDPYCIMFFLPVLLHQGSHYYYYTEK